MYCGPCQSIREISEFNTKNEPTDIQTYMEISAKRID